MRGADEGCGDVTIVDCLVLEGEWIVMLGGSVGGGVGGGGGGLDILCDDTDDVDACDDADADGCDDDGSVDEGVIDLCLLCLFGVYLLLKMFRDLPMMERYHNLDLFRRVCLILEEK